MICTAFWVLDVDGVAAVGRGGAEGGEWGRGEAKYSCRLWTICVACCFSSCLVLESRKSLMNLSFSAISLVLRASESSRLAILRAELSIWLPRVL